MENNPKSELHDLHKEVEVLEEKNRLLKKKLELSQELQKIETQLAALRPAWVPPATDRFGVPIQGPPPWYAPWVVTSTNAVVPGVNRNGDAFPPAEATSGYTAPAPTKEELLTMSSEDLRAVQNCGMLHTKFTESWSDPSAAELSDPLHGGTVRSTRPRPLKAAP